MSYSWPHNTSMVAHPCKQWMVATAVQGTGASIALPQHIVCQAGTTLAALLPAVYWLQEQTCDNQVPFNLYHLSKLYHCTCSLVAAIACCNVKQPHWHLKHMCSKTCDSAALCRCSMAGRW